MGILADQVAPSTDLGSTKPPPSLSDASRTTTGPAPTMLKDQPTTGGVNTDTQPTMSVMDIGDRGMITDTYDAKKTGSTTGGMTTTSQPTAELQNTRSPSIIDQWGSGTNQPTGTNQLPGGGYGGSTPGGQQQEQSWHDWFTERGYEYDPAVATWKDPATGQCYGPDGRKRPCGTQNPVTTDPGGGQHQGGTYTPPPNPGDGPVPDFNAWLNGYDPFWYQNNPDATSYNDTPRVNMPRIQINNQPSQGLDGLYAEGFESEKSEAPTWTTTQAQLAGSAQTNPDLGGEYDLSTGGVDPAAAEGYDAYTQQVDPNSLAGARMAALTAQDSPLMQRARQEGLLTAGRRGLLNSSLAAGSAMGSMVDRAQPLALSEAEHLQQQALTNQGAINQARQFSAGLLGQIEQLNAQLASQEKIAGAQLTSDEKKLGAQIGSTESMFDREQANQMAQFNANWTNQAKQLQAEMNLQSQQFNIGQQNAINTRILELNTELNKQYLAGSQAMDLATIQGQFNQLISQNQMAAEFFSSGMNAIGQAMANPELDPARIASYVAIQQDLIQSGLQLMADMNNIQLGTGSTSAPGPTGGAGGAGGTGGSVPNPFAPGFDWNALTPQQQQALLQSMGANPGGRRG